MGLAGQLVCQVLWRREGSVADTKERFDLVQYRLGGCLPVLLYTRGYDHHCRRHAVF